MGILGEKLWFLGCPLRDSTSSRYAAYSKAVFPTLSQRTPKSQRGKSALLK